jgi:hypothetical protein
MLVGLRVLLMIMKACVLVLTEADGDGGLFVLL